MANKYTSLINEKNIFCANVRENVKVNNCFLAHLAKGNVSFCHPIDVSYQVSDHLAKRFQRRRFLEIDQSETRIAVGNIYERFSIKIDHFVRIH
jgi:hypothetical protein